MGALNGSFMRRSRRVRHTLKRVANERVRLSVFRSSRHIYAQVIDDQAGKTLAAASTLDKDLKGALPKGSDVPSTNMTFNLHLQDFATSLPPGETYPSHTTNPNCW